MHDPASNLILVVDDEADIRSMVVQALSRLPGCELYEASSKTSALKMLQQHSFDLVLSDLSMEDDNAGVELLQEVKQHQPDTIVILLTGYATLETAVAALQLGAANYLMKPSSVRELRDSVTKALERRSESMRQRQLLANIANHAPGTQQAARAGNPNGGAISACGAGPILGGRKATTRSAYVSGQRWHGNPGPDAN